MYVLRNRRCPQYVRDIPYEEMALGGIDVLAI